MIARLQVKLLIICYKRIIRHKYDMQLKNAKIVIIGLGYVGLPLAVEFAKKYPVVGFDINQASVDELNSRY